MKKAVIALLMFFIGCQTKDPTVIIGVNAEFPPYEYLYKNEFKGSNIEIIQAILSNTGLDYKFQNMSFDGLLAALQQQKTDIVIGVNATDERRKNVDFSITYDLSQDVLITRTNSDVDFNNLKDLKIGALSGSTQEPILNSLENVTAVIYPSYTGALLDLKTQKLDGIVIANHTAKQYIKENPDLHIVGTFEKKIEEGMAFAFNKKNTALKDIVNKSLQELIDNGTVEEISEKYHAEENIN